MTPARLRQIAERLETVCEENRLRIHGIPKPACDGCKADARDLREFADNWETFKTAFEATGIIICAPSAKLN